jgi:hypothetical protein
MRLLRSLSRRFEGDQPKSRGFRPPSPVKLLSNFLSGAVSPQKQPYPKMGEIPSIPLGGRELARSESQWFDRDPKTNDEGAVSSNKLTKAATNPFLHLEEILAAYIITIQMRAGDIAGCSLRSRWQVEERIINDIYNTLCMFIIRFYSLEIC